MKKFILMDDKELQRWKLKNLILDLKSIVDESNTSMLSIAIRAGSSIHETTTKLNQEMGTADNVKSRVNRLSILSAIVSAQGCLKGFKTTPPNGLLLYVGSGTSERLNKTKKFSYCIEPCLLVKSSMYHCGNTFQISQLEEMLIEEEPFGFIIIDGSSCLLARVKGTSKEILTQFSVDLPKKHGKGGQSSVRFERLRVEAIGHYISKCVDLINMNFIRNNEILVRGLIIGGMADKKTLLQKNDKIDYRLKSLFMAEYELTYGGELGFNNAF